MKDNCFRLIKKKKKKGFTDIFLAESLHFAEMGSKLFQPCVKLG